MCVSYDQVDIWEIPTFYLLIWSDLVCVWVCATIVGVCVCVSALYLCVWSCMLFIRACVCVHGRKFVCVCVCLCALCMC